MEQNNVFVFEGEKKERLDKVLTTKFPDKSRSYWQKLIQTGYVTVNGITIMKANELVSSGDEIILTPREEQSLKIEAEDIPLTIVYQDSELAVINKEAGMVVHPAHGHESGTLVNALLYHLSDLSSINGIIRPGIVHRIDKDTSGLLVVAKNDAAHIFLSDQLKEKTLYREYLALVHGNVKENSFMIDLPIGRHPQKRKDMAVVENGKMAKTHVEVVKRFKDYTLVKCLLETGRTHQIRVHLQYIGFPIVGDPLYTQRKNDFDLDGQFLHAYKLGFIHPKTHKAVQFNAEIPEKLKRILAELETEENI